jgi:quinol-cytochrome oxidoreductase complex cytochrome b subunit
MHYSADTALAFDSVEHITCNVNFGWLLRYTHSNGAPMFLLVIYIHMAGVILFLLLMATAFLGYVLPWGQMSLRLATVITNLATAIPLVGQKVAYWLWCRYSVDNATLTRFFNSFFNGGADITSPLVLHVGGSTNPLGLEDSHDFIPFYPYFLIKDVFGFLVFLFSFF